MDRAWNLKDHQFMKMDEVAVLASTNLAASSRHQQYQQWTRREWWLTRSYLTSQTATTTTPIVNKLNNNNFPPNFSCISINNSKCSYSIGQIQAQRNLCSYRMSSCPISSQPSTVWRRMAWSRLTLPIQTRVLWETTMKTECQLSWTCRNHRRKSVNVGPNARFSPFLTDMVGILAQIFFEIIFINLSYEIQNFQIIQDRPLLMDSGSQKCTFWIQWRNFQQDDQIC